MQTDGSVKTLPLWSLTGLVASIRICGLVPGSQQFYADLSVLRRISYNGNMDLFTHNVVSFSAVWLPAESLVPRLM